MAKKPKYTITIFRGLDGAWNLRVNGHTYIKSESIGIVSGVAEIFYYEQASIPIRELQEIANNIRLIENEKAFAKNKQTVG